MTAYDPASNPTLSSGYNDVTLAAVVSENMLDEERPNNVSRPFFRDDGPGPSVARDFPIQHDPGAASSNYTEGTGLTNSALTTDKATATALANGIMATVTDEVNETAVLDVNGQVTMVLARSCAEEFETTATALFDDFANTSGTAGVATSYATLLDATGALSTRDQGMGTLVGVLDPAQIVNVRKDLGTSGAGALANPAFPINTLVNGDPLPGFAFGNLAGADWFQTSLVTSSGGGVFLRNVAVGLYMLRDTRIETHRVPQLPGLQIVATTRYGVIEIRDRAGQTIVSA